MSTKFVYNKIYFSFPLIANVRLCNIFLIQWKGFVIILYMPLAAIMRKAAEHLHDNNRRNYTCLAT